MEYIMNSKTKLTSVKVLESLYKNFKGCALRDDFTLQKIVNRSLHQYLTDVDYQKSMLEYDKLQISGSRF